MNKEISKAEEEAELTLMRALVEERMRMHVSQAELAARMQVKPPTLARIEGESQDSRISTLTRYAQGLGKRIAWQIIDA